MFSTTLNPLGVYQIVAGVQLLGQWVHAVYRPWLREQVLGIKGEGYFQTCQALYNRVTEYHERSRKYISLQSLVFVTIHKIITAAYTKNRQVYSNSSTKRDQRPSDNQLATVRCLTVNPKREQKDRHVDEYPLEMQKMFLRKLAKQENIAKGLQDQDSEQSDSEKENEYRMRDITKVLDKIWG
jgi:hypothetical protein